MITFLNLRAFTCLLSITNSVSRLSNQKLNHRIKRAHEGGSYDKEITTKRTQVRVPTRHISNVFIHKTEDGETKSNDNLTASIFQAAFQSPTQSPPTMLLVSSESPTPMKHGNIFHHNMGGDYGTSDIKSLTLTAYIRTGTNAPPNNTSAISNIHIIQDYKEEEQGSPKSFGLMPVLFTGLTTAILFCTIFLVCAQRCDRKARAKLGLEQQIINEHLNDDGSTQNSADLQEWHNDDSTDRSSIKERNKGDNHGHGNWIHTMMQELVNYHPCNDGQFTNILPPMMQSDGEETRDMYDDLSTSLVSTLSGSDGDGSVWYPDYEEIQPRIVSQQGDDLRATPRIEIEKRYNSKKILSKTVKRLLKIASDSFEETSYSDWSSLTGDSTANSYDSELLGEICLSEDKMEQIEKSTDNASDDLIPLDYGEYSTCNRLNATNLHQSRPKSIPTLDIEANSSNSNLSRDGGKLSFCAKQCFERDVFFPVTSLQDFGVIGIEIEDPPNEYEYPKISYVDPNGELCGRILSGDSIVRVNGKKMCGATRLEILKCMIQKEEDDTETISIIHLTLFGSKPKRIVDGQYGMLEGRGEI